MSRESSVITALYNDSQARTVAFYGSEYQCISCGDLLDEGLCCSACSNSSEVEQMLSMGHGVQIIAKGAAR